MVDIVNILDTIDIIGWNWLICLIGMCSSTFGGIHGNSKQIIGSIQLTPVPKLLNFIFFSLPHGYWDCLDLG